MLQQLKHENITDLIEVCSSKGGFCLYFLLLPGRYILQVFVKSMSWRNVSMVAFLAVKPYRTKSPMNPRLIGESTKALRSKERGSTLV